jgi:hypothetical protein
MVIDASVARGAAGLAALLLLPGFLVVRAPWAAVPFLSLVFWIASWWWLPGVGRERFLVGALMAFGLGALLRIVRLGGRRPPWPALLALAAVLLRASAGLMPVAGRGVRLDVIPAQLMVWHDGLPVTYVPLREAGSFGAHPHGFDALGADVALLTGLAVPRAVALAAAVAGALSVLGLYALLVRRLAPEAAALLTVGVAVVVSLVQLVTGGGDPAWLLALGFVLAASGLLVSGGSRAGAVAAGAFAGTALMTAPAVVGVGLAAGVAAVALARKRISPERAAALRRRLGVAATAAIATGAPYALHFAIALVR